MSSILLKIIKDWRTLAILLGTSIIAEGVILAIWLQQVPQRTVHIEYPLLGIIVILLFGLLWITEPPRISNEEETTPKGKTTTAKEVTDKMDEASLTQIENVDSQNIQLLPVIVSVSQSETGKKRQFTLSETRWFIVSKDGEEFENGDRCEDKLAINHSLRRYAVADGAAQSFLPGEWANYLVKDFVNNGTFNSQNIESWLKKCAEQWQEWAKEKWIPKARATRMYLPDELEKYLHKGPYATFVGCIVDPVAGTTTANIQVFAWGDAHFFLYCPDEFAEESLRCFPYKSFQEFGKEPEVLGKSERRIKRACELMKDSVIYERVCLEKGLVILTSDELAKWIFLQKELENYNELERLFKITAWEGFKESVQKMRANARIRRDDMTMVVIPLRQFMSVSSEVN